MANYSAHKQGGLLHKIEEYKWTSESPRLDSKKTHFLKIGFGCSVQMWL